MSSIAPNPPADYPEHILWPKDFGTVIQDTSQSILYCPTWKGHVRMDVPTEKVQACPLCGGDPRNR